MSVMTGPTRLAAKLPTRLLATFAAAWAGVAASPALARAAYVRVVGAGEKPTIAGSWRALSFGLSSAQREELYRLTRGAVDLRGMYRVDTDDAHGYSDVTAQRGVKWLGVADRRAVSSGRPRRDEPAPVSRCRADPLAGSSPRRSRSRAGPRSARRHRRPPW